MNKWRSMLVLPFVLLSGACTDPFGALPLDRVQSETVWGEPSLMRAYVSDLYARFPWYGFPTGAGSHAGAANASWTGELWGSTPNPTTTNDAGGYFDYSYIRALNVFLEEIDRLTDFPAALGNQMKGEVKTMRAVVYYEMQKRYGGVPLVDVVLDPFDADNIDDRYRRRATEEEIADFIDRELTEAIALLSPDRLPTGRINRWAAYAYKAHANLWSASIAKFPSPLASQSTLIGIPAGRAGEFYQKAAAAADAVINSGVYSLYTGHLNQGHTENYRRIFLLDGNSEIIFERNYDGIFLSADYTTNNIFHLFASGPGGSHVMYERLLEFEDLDGSFTAPEFGPERRYNDGIEPWMHKDPRLRALTWFQGEEYGGRPIEIWEGLDPSPAGTANPSAILGNNLARYPDPVNSPTRQVGREARLAFGTQLTLSGLHLKKYIMDLPPGLLSWVRQEDKNHIQIRLAEMYLIKAESEFELGNLGAAAEALNATRTRAGLLPIEEVGGITRQRVRRERMSELAQEGGHRYWDFRRWRIAEQELNDRTFCGFRTILHFEEQKFYFLPSTTAVLGCEPTTRQFQAQHYYNPMTDARRANNPHLEENPGY